MTTEQIPDELPCRDKQIDILVAKVKELEKKLDDQGFEYADKIQILEDKLNYCLARVRRAFDDIEYDPCGTYAILGELIAKIEAEKQQ